MSEIIVSEQHKKAVALNQKIIVSAELAQQNLWDMCVSLKTMRDDKLYKELGYENFEGYCENEVGMKRRNAYNYIAIVEKINLESVQPVAQIGIKKLSLLATLSDEQQKEVSEKVSLEDTTYRELKAEIDRLKEEKKRKQQELSNTVYERDDLKNKNIALKNEKSRLESEMEQKLSITNCKQLEAERALKGVQECNTELAKQLNAEKMKNSELHAKVVELENRPIEVAVAEPSDNERLLKETIDFLRRDSARKNDELEKQYIEDTRNMRENFEKDKQKAVDEAVSGKQQEIDNLTYELAKAKSQNGMTHEEKEYRLAYMNAENALKALQSVIEKYNIKPGEAIGLCDTFIFIVKGL